MKMSENGGQATSSTSNATTSESINSNGAIPLLTIDQIPKP